MIKLVTLTLATLLSTHVLAHPSDSESIIVIDNGSELSVLKDINIPSHNNMFIKDGVLTPTASAGPGETGCILQVTDHMYYPLHRDVVIKSGDTLTLSSSWDHRGFQGFHQRLDFITKHGGYLILNCGTLQRSKRISFKEITIGKLKKILGDTGSIKLADPLEL